ncbi:hypothetical protein, variant [Aphanomyces invadans]|uniref:DUF4954 domain-containing protein n=1 Tax=Aphanomyces invadans TaxID=157072 RepID=A0A024U0N0_9STRA|nr:hypothetical protein, variant [Aphanomyces invadans]ETV99818.1 hypothetical protein, variant [Aphanomyces invadans]|eukprot:XP_008871594.1 hypothetical protein, variant [Aphanomyces invadans]
MESAAAFAHQVTPFLTSGHQLYAASCRDTMRRFHTQSPVTPAQIQVLEQQGNRADSWDSVYTKGSAASLKRVRNCTFRGRVYLGDFEKDVMVDNVPFPSGCYNSTVVDSYVLDNALVQDTFLLHRTYVSQGAVIVGCGTITCSGPEVTYGNGTVLKVGVEIGGREIAMFADMPFHLAAIVGESRGNAAELKAYEDLVRTYAKSVRCDGFNVIARQAKVLRCPKIRDVFVGDGGVVEDSVVSNSTILSTPAEFSSIVGFSQVHSSILQWNAHVDGGSSVERSFLFDCSHVERHGMVMDSLLGPNTAIAEGECTSTFLGPFVGFHHQAMIVAAFWPRGRGNIGYGANVGSNHTLKAPDQELWPGEGVFYGLSVSIKYPSNFTNAAYSVIATGVSTLPQKLDMPFALVNIPGHNIPELSPAINEIYPGWVLSHSIFTVLRNQDKFDKRNKSKRTKLDAPIFRPDIVTMMQVACQRLVDAEKKPVKIRHGREIIYTEKQVPGLGKNYMTESSRVVAIEAYSFYTRVYALEGYWHMLQRGAFSVETPLDQVSIPENLDHDTKARWSHQRAILADGVGVAQGGDLLRELVAAYKSIAKNAEDGKSRDDKRGQHIIPDYNLVHKKASEERIVIEAHRRATDLERAVANYLPRL